jgi:MFS family permease
MFNWLFPSRIAVSAMFFFMGFIFASWASRIPVYKNQFHLNEAELGTVLFMLPLGSFIALPFAGWSVDRFGSRIMGVISTSGYGLALYGLSQAQTSFSLSVMLFIFGFVGDTVNISMNTQALDLQTAYRRPILSSFHALWSLGALSGALLGGWTLKTQIDTEMHFLMVAIAVGVLCFWSWFYLIPHDGRKEKGKKLLALPDRSLLVIGAVCLCCTLCEGAMADWSALYYNQVKVDATTISTTGFTAYVLMMAMGRFSGDRLVMAMGYRKVLILDGIFVAGGMALALALKQPWLVIAGFGLVGFGVSTVIPIAYTAAAKSETMKASVALAAVSTIGFTGFLIGPPLIGFIAHEIGLRAALALVILLGIVIIVLARRAVRH